LKRELSISLAAKCQLLFGLAVLVIITGALAVPWQRMEQLTARQPVYEAHVVADLALRQVHEQGRADMELTASPVSKKALVRWNLAQLPGEHYPMPKILPLQAPDMPPRGADEVTLRAVTAFLNRGNLQQFGLVKPGPNHRRIYQYAAAVRASRSCLPCHANWTAWFAPRPGRVSPRALGPTTRRLTAKALLPASTAATRPATSRPKPVILPTGTRHPLVAVVRVDMPVHVPENQLLLNRIVIVVSGLIGGTLAIIVFYLITTRLILQPVRVLKNTAEKVAAGDLAIRSAITTGDEFEQLSDTFNTMLTTLKNSQDQLEASNRSLDTRVGELAQSNVDLFTANRVKSEFLTNVSHELRTPLNAIIGFAELLSNSEALRSDAKLARYLENIQNSARQLLDLINDLLDLAKIEAGKIVLRQERINVPDVCESLINFMKPLAQKKGIDLTLAVDKDIPLVQTDPGRFGQILYNFVSNAVKFTPQDGKIKIAVENLDPQHVRVSVSDTGPGIAPEHQAEIFEKFHQLDASVTRQHSGTGLGLAISRELATLLQGKIEVVSALGKGATFSLVVPVMIAGGSAV
jgi:signal transduction histidine kinase